MPTDLSRIPDLGASDAVIGYSKSPPMNFVPVPTPPVPHTDLKTETADFTDLDLRWYLTHAKRTPSIRAALLMLVWKDDDTGSTIQFKTKGAANALPPFTVPVADAEQIITFVLPTDSNGKIQYKTTDGAAGGTAVTKANLYILGFWELWKE